MVQLAEHPDFEPEDEGDESFFDSNKIQAFVEKLVEAVDIVIELKKINLSILNYNLPVFEPYVITAGRMDHTDDPAMEYFISRNSKKIISIYPKSAATAADYDENYKIREFHIKGETYRVKIFTKNLEFFNINEFHLKSIMQQTMADLETEVIYVGQEGFGDKTADKVVAQPDKLPESRQEGGDNNIFDQLEQLFSTGDEVTSIPKGEPDDPYEPEENKIGFHEEFDLDFQQDVINFAYGLREAVKLFIAKNQFAITTTEREIYKRHTYTLSIGRQVADPQFYVYTIREAGTLLVQMAKTNESPQSIVTSLTTSEIMNFADVGTYAITFFTKNEKKIETLKEFLGIFRDSILLGETTTSVTYADTETTDSGIRAETILPDEGLHELQENLGTTFKRIWDQILKRLRGGS